MHNYTMIDCIYTLSNKYTVHLYTVYLHNGNSITLDTYTLLNKLLYIACLYYSP